MHDGTEEFVIFEDVKFSGLAEDFVADEDTVYGRARNARPSLLSATVRVSAFPVVTWGFFLGRPRGLGATGGDGKGSETRGRRDRVGLPEQLDAPVNNDLAGEDEAPDVAGFRRFETLLRSETVLAFCPRV